MPDPGVPDFWFLHPVLIVAAVFGALLLFGIGALIQHSERKAQRQAADYRAEASAAAQRGLQAESKPAASSAPHAPAALSLDQGAGKMWSDCIVAADEIFVAAGIDIRLTLKVVRAGKQLADHIGAVARSEYGSAAFDLREGTVSAVSTVDGRRMVVGPWPATPNETASMIARCCLQMWTTEIASSPRGAAFKAEARALIEKLSLDACG